MNGIIKIYNKLSIDENEKNNFNILIFESEFKNGEINGGGKEYNNYGELIFIGEYSRGKKMKGKEYKYNKLLFEGEYKNGKRWNGKGKEYKDIEKLKFEDKYLNKYLNLNEERRDIRKENSPKVYNIWKIHNGVDGKENEQKEKLSFEGEYLNGERDGKGKEYDFIGNIIFEGEYKNNKRWNGKGKEYKEIEKLEFEDKYFNKYLNLNEERMVKDKEYDSADSMDFQLYKNYERSDGKKKEKKKK